MNMRDPLVRHQVIEYQHNEPFYIGNVFVHDADYTYIKHSHWHEELEIAYCLRGSAAHYIDGERVEARPGRIIVTNCESVHRIEAEPDSLTAPDELASIVLIVQNRFVEENFPEYRDFWFTNPDRTASAEIRGIMLEFSEYAKRSEHRLNEHLYMRGLLLQLLYYLYQEGVVSRSDVVSAKRHEHVQPLKEILQYVEDHYREPIAQADVAREFFFTPQYFSRYFKRCTGITFVGHLTTYRVEQAQKELLHTDRRISDIARDNGFRDDRSFINAFKRIHHVTPQQYRKRFTDTVASKR